MRAVPSNVLALPDRTSQRAVRLVLVRHGQTTWNRERRFLGRTDVPLDDIGIAQARNLAARLARTDLAAIYSSPLRRAADTAAAVAALHGLPVTPQDDLVELAQGELEGQESHILADRYPDFFAAWLADPTHARVPGGETLGECQSRGLRALRGVIGRAEAGTTVVVVSHQMVIASVLCGLLDRPLREFRAVGHHNGALSVLDAVDQGIEVVTINDRAHLDAGG